VTPAEVSERLAALRERGAALRRRPGAEVIEILARVLERWRHAGGPERRALERDLPGVTGFAPAVVREGLALALAPWSGDALRAIARRDLSDGADGVRGHDTTAVLLAGSIPMPSLLGVLEPLAVRSPVLVKTASRDPLTAHLVKQSVAAVAPDLADCIEIVEFPGADETALAAFLEADCIVATGSDETVDAVTQRTRPPRRVVRHGHKLSVAVLGAEATGGDALVAAARGLARDTALWDQQGGLSPVASYAVGGVEAARAGGPARGDALGPLEARLPRGVTDAASDALTAHERAGVELRAAAGEPVAAHSGERHAWTVVVEADARPRPIPLQRFLRVHPVADVAALPAALAPLGPHLAGVALAGLRDAEAAWVENTVRGLGASRCCPPGSLQAPPLDWPRDGQAAFSALASGRSRDTSA
jgi:hypothetical protein